MANEFIARNGFRSQNNSDITGSLNVTAGITGSFTGSLTGIATTASYVNPLVQNVLVTGSLTVSSSNANQFQVGSNLVYVSSSGNVGIGTTSPSYLLDVNGTAKIQKDGVGTYSLYTTKNISGSTGAYNATSLNSMAVTSTGTGGYQSAALKNYLIINQNSTYNYTFGHEWSAMTNELNISSYGGVTAGADRIANTVIKSVIGYNRSITDTLIDLYFLYENYGTVGTHWGIFHGSTDAKHYFGGKMMIGTSTDINYKFRVLGSSSFSGNVDITGSASNSLRVKGSGATNATNAVLVENSSGVATFSVDDSGVTRMGPSGSEYMIVKNTLNVGINNSTPTAFLHVRSNQTNGSTFVFLAQNQDAVTFSGNNGGIGTIMAIKDNYTVVITGSTTITGSLVVTGSANFASGITGSFLGTASYAAMALTASYALSSAGGGGGSTFPYTGSAIISGSLEITGSFSVFTGSATEFQVNATGVKIGNIAGDIHTITGSVYISSISSSEERVLTTVSGGLVTSSAQVLIQAYIDPLGTIAGYLNSTSSWDINGDYSGSVISGTYQGQKHYNSNYFFEAVDDNVWIRLIRG